MNDESARCFWMTLDGDGHQKPSHFGSVYTLLVSGRQYTFACVPLALICAPSAHTAITRVLETDTVIPLLIWTEPQ